jgi:hypothetical protein
MKIKEHILYILWNILQYKKEHILYILWNIIVVQKKLAKG